MPDRTTSNKIPPGFTLRQTLQGHRGYITRIAWSPDGRALASASGDGTIRLWGAMGERLLRRLKGVSGAIYSVAWSPDGQKLAFDGSKDTALLWDVERKVFVHTLRGHSGRVADVAWSPDGQTLATAGADNAVRLWDAEAGLLLHILKRHGEIVNSVAWSPDGRSLASASNDGTVRLWDSKNGQLQRTIETHSEWVLDVAWSPNGQALIFAGDAATIETLDTRTWQATTVLEGHVGDITSLSFSFDGRLLASNSIDDTVRLWRCDTWECVAVVGESSSLSLYSGLSFHPTEPVLATLGESNTVRVWDLDFEAVLGGASKSKSKSVFYTTAKIALVGDSGVGKTGLGWRLAHGKFKEHPSTHGQQFWVIDELGATRKDGTQCEAVLWDLAGQPDYRLVHALFLDDVDLALVLFDPTNRQEPLKGVEYWLKQLARERRDGRGRRTMIIGARADRGTPTLTREELEEFCNQYGVGGYVGTSALTGEGLAELMERVRALVVWDEIPATVTTTTFKRIKEFVLALKEDGGREGVLLSPAELQARLEATDAEWKFSDAEMMTAVRHLANHGYVTVLRDSKGEETILLVPDLLANLAASIVLEARRSPKELGALDEARVLQGGYKFAELAELGKDEREVLLGAAAALFLGHNLCFRESLGRQTILVFPALINQKRPHLDEVTTVDDVSYQVSGAVENVYAALVVLLGYTSVFTRTNQWQNQAQYEMGEGEVCGFRQVVEREGEIELVLYYGATVPPHTRLLFQGLFEKFLRSRDVTVAKYPPVNCPECGYRQERAEIIKRVGAGKDFLFCNECGERVALPPIGEEVALSRRDREELEREQVRARVKTAFEAALVRVKTVVRDERKSAPSCFISYAWGDTERERWVRGLAADLRNAGVGVVLDQQDNSAFGENVARFISLIERSDFVVVVATPLYRQKYDNKLSTTGSVVAAEVDLINLRLTKTEEKKKTVLPLLVEGDDEASLPPLMQGKVYGDFRQETLYFAVLFDLILTLYRIPFQHAAVSDLRESLRGGAERPR